MKSSTEREKETLSAMIDMYCRSFHGGKALCSECAGLKDYALNRVDRCQFGEEKPACRECPVHCFSPKRRSEVRQIMRFAGPRMVFRHPVMAIMHALK